MTYPTPRVCVRPEGLRTMLRVPDSWNPVAFSRYISGVYVGRRLRTDTHRLGSRALPSGSRVARAAAAHLGSSAYPQSVVSGRYEYGTAREYVRRAEVVRNTVQSAGDGTCATV